MHILELPHTFPKTLEKDRDKKHLFTKGATHNYMDYNNPKKYTQKWQWELMRKSNFLKLLILVMNLFLFYCKTMSYQEIKQVSCGFEQLISKEDKKIELPFKGEKYYEIDNDSIYRGISEHLHDSNNRFTIFTDYRKMGIKSYTAYNLNGNISSKFFL